MNTYSSLLSAVPPQHREYAPGAPRPPRRTAAGASAGSAMSAGCECGTSRAARRRYQAMAVLQPDAPTWTTGAWVSQEIVLTGRRTPYTSDVSHPGSEDDLADVGLAVLNVLS